MNRCQMCNSQWFVWSQTDSIWFCAECGTLEKTEIVEAQEAIDWLLETMNLEGIEVEYDNN